MGFIKKTITTNDMFAALRIRSFSFMMISEFFSQLAFNMQHFVLIFVVFELTKSNTAVSGIILSFTIPALLFSLVSGMYVDRWNKKSVLFYTNLIRGLLILPFLIRNLHVSLIYTLTFLIAVTTQFFLPAEGAIIPSLVPKNLLLAANAVFSLGIYGTMLLGYIFSGPIILLFGRTTTFFFLSVLFFLSTFFILLITLPKKRKNTDLLSQTVPSLAHEAREIFIFMRKARKVMHALIMLTIAQAIIFTFAVIAPGYATTILKIQLESLSWIIIAPAAIGMGFGAVLLGSIGKKFDRKLLSCIGFILSGFVFILFTFGNRVTSDNFIKTINSYLPYSLNITILNIVIVLAVIIGFAISLVFIPSNTTIQMETNELMRGRVYGFLNALIGAVSFFPVIIAGGLSDLFGLTTVIIGSGIAMIIMGFLFLIFN